MEKLMLHRAAALFEKKRDTICMMVLLTSLMTNQVAAASALLFLNACTASILAVMTEEDAREQTIDIRLLSILFTAMLFIAAYHAETAMFLQKVLCGTIFFRVLLLGTSLITTWQAEYRRKKHLLPIAIPEKIDDDAAQATGYIPIFMFVFILYLGIGTDFSSFIFSETAFALFLIKETMLPESFTLMGVSWLTLEWYFWQRERKKANIVWAFGGGDVLFLGFFAGHVGLSAILALFFLSLITRIAQGIIQTLLDHISEKSLTRSGGA